MTYIVFDGIGYCEFQSNSGTKAKEDLAAATRAVEVCFFTYKHLRAYSAYGSGLILGFFTLFLILTFVYSFDFR